MYRPIAIGLAALWLAGVLSSADAQQAPSDSARAKLVQGVKSDLRNYVTAQERYYADHATYAAATSATPLQPSPGVSVIVLTFGPTGHSAVAIHSDLPDLVCAIWVGREPRPPLHDGAREGEPTCRLP